MTSKEKQGPYPSAREGLREAERCEPTPQTLSPSYRLAFADQEFLLQDEMRPVRLQLELQKPETLLRAHGVVSTVVVFGSARIPDPDTAARQLEVWESLARSHPDSPRHREQAERQRRLAAKARWYADAVFAEPQLQFDFEMAAGQIQFVDNLAIGHSRTRFEDFEEPARRRHLVRLWMRDAGDRAYPG